MLNKQASNYERTRAWLAACGKTPGKEALSVQVGCHLEEFSEFLRCLVISSPTGVSANLLVEAQAVLDSVGTLLKNGVAQVDIYDREGALDALCDCEVTGNGVAYLAGFDKEEADRRVLDSNDDKFEEDGKPVILPGGKIGKRQGWAAPDLGDLVGEATQTQT